MSERPGWPPGWLYVGLIGIVVLVWAVEEIAATFGAGSNPPDPALTLAISGIVGALAASGFKR